MPIVKVKTIHHVNHVLTYDDRSFSLEFEPVSYLTPLFISCRATQPSLAI